MTREEFDARWAEAREPAMVRSLGILGSPADAEDAVQTTAEYLWRAQAQYDPSTSFVAWAVRVAHRRSLHALRDRRARRTLSIDKPIHDVEPEKNPRLGYVESGFATVIQGFDTQDDAEYIRCVVDTALLVSPFGVVEAVMRHYGGMSAAQVGERLGLHEGTVRTRARRGLATLRRIASEIQRDA